MKWIDPEVERLVIMAIQDAVDQTGRAKHGALFRSRDIQAGARPFEEGRVLAIDTRRNELSRFLEEVSPAGGRDLPVELRRRQRAAEGVDVLQVLPEETVEEEVVVGGEIRAVPPEPVAAFRSVDLAKGSASLLSRERAGVHSLLEESASIAEQVPRAVLFLFADPDIEVAPDPGARMQGGDALLRRMMAEVVLDGAGVQLFLLRFDPAVQFPEESFAAVGERFPRILAIEDEWDDPCIERHRLRDFRHVMQEMVGRRFGMVFGSHETDEV